MSYKRSILLRVRVSFLVVFLFSIAVIYRLVDLQYLQGDKWKHLGEQIGLRFQKVDATRGNIYSDNGALLATSLPYYRVALDPCVATSSEFNHHIDSLSLLLSKFYGDQTARYYKNKIVEARKDRRRYIVLNRRQVGYQEKKAMERWPLFRRGRMRGGIIFEKVEKRVLPFSHLGYRTVGSVNDENRGTVGLEYSFNRYLAGKDGQALYQRMSGGGWKPVADGSEIPPVDGYDIETTINIDLQDIAESALLKALLRHEADYGVVVLMEVATGEIKAMSNLSRNGSGQYFERYNYAVGSQGAREPGSTFKLASMIALFEEKEISLSDTIHTGNGTMKFFNEVMKDHRPGGFGVLTVQEVFELSSNIGTAKLINRHFGDDPQAFIDYLIGMGLSQPLGFQMVGEGKPFIKSPSEPSWSGTTLPWMAHGYELKMTPLQTLTLYNAVANDGKMVQPLIVKSVRQAGSEVEQFRTKVLHEKICSDKTLNKVKTLLEGVVENGTAKNVYDSKYQIAGKTGTAKRVENGRYTNQYYTSFAGYFPAKAPRYSCIVVIDNPKGFQIYGSDVAAPVFKEVVDEIALMELDLNDRKAEGESQPGVFPVVRSGRQADLEVICNELGIANHSESDDPWVTTRIIGNSIQWVPNKMDMKKVPDVQGMTLRDAIYILENSGLVVETRGRGRVETQSIAPGSNISSNSSKIILTLG